MPPPSPLTQHYRQENRTMRTRTALALAALAALAFIGTTACAAEVLPPPAPGHMYCYHVNGSVESVSIDTAAAYHGGIVYTAAGFTFVTTQRCIARPVIPAAVAHGSKVVLPPPPTPPVRASIHCDGDTLSPDGAIAYHNIAADVALTSGVWTWTEESTGDVYVSTLGCHAAIVTE